MSDYSFKIINLNTNNKTTLLNTILRPIPSFMSVYYYKYKCIAQYLYQLH